MSKRMTTWQKATALVPLALLSGAWTASLAVSSATASDTAEEETASASLPDGSTVPSDAVDQPANISAPGEVAPGVPKGSEDSVVKSASTNGIPSAALAAYQRAAQVIDSADASCNIEWPLVAAIGRVESNHGRYGGNTLSAEGVSTPGIYGIPLNGGNGTQRITDTDAGQFDNDKQFDRAVGPMQFIPSTWSVVGVDGDGDGERDPQDIDDAALATAVYLCSGDEDLGERAGQESAVFRYNHSNDYVALVLSIMEAYASGDYSAVPNNSTAPTTFTPSYGDSVMGGGTKGFTPPKAPASRPGSTGGGSTTTSGGTTTTTGGETTSEEPAPVPTQEPAPAPTTESSPEQTVKDTTDKVTNTVKDTVNNTVKDPGGAVQDTLTAAEAKAECIAEGVLTLNLQSCIDGKL
jgi:membrane-bound lytic murein transglycosylase B